MRSDALKALLIVAVLLLIPIGFSAQIACCAGMSSMGSMDMDASGCGEGMSCCDKAHDDALARHCCEGGERLDRQPTFSRLSAALPMVLPAAPTLTEQALLSVRWSPRPPPKAPDLFTLHSALLI